MKPSVHLVNPNTNKNLNIEINHQNSKSAYMNFSIMIVFIAAIVLSLGFFSFKDKIPFLNKHIVNIQNLKENQEKDNLSHLDFDLPRTLAFSSPEEKEIKSSSNNLPLQEDFQGLLTPPALPSDSSPTTQEEPPKSPEPLPTPKPTPPPPQTQPSSPSFEIQKAISNQSEKPYEETTLSMLRTLLITENHQKDIVRLKVPVLYRSRTYALPQNEEALRKLLSSLQTAISKIQEAEKIIDQIEKEWIEITKNSFPASILYPDSPTIPINQSPPSPSEKNSQISFEVVE